VIAEANTDFHALLTDEYVAVANRGRVFTREGLRAVCQAHISPKGGNGFIDWAWSSEPLIKSGVFYRARQQIVPLPENSFAARQDMSIDNTTGVVRAKGVWLGDEEVHEMTVFSPRNEMSISLLIYPDDAPGKWDRDLEEPTERDTYEQFVIGGQV